MFRVHCYTNDTCERYGLLFPENTYETSSLEKVNETIKNVLDNESSGISKIVIERDHFSVNTQSPMNLDK